MWGSGKYLEQWRRWKTVNAELWGLGTWGEPFFLSALCHGGLEVRSCLWHHGLLVHCWKLWTSFLKKYTNVHFVYNSGPFYVCFQKIEVSWLLSANRRISMQNFKNKIKLKKCYKVHVADIVWQQFRNRHPRSKMESRTGPTDDYSSQRN